MGNRFYPYERNSKVTFQRHICTGRGLIGAIFTINLSRVPFLLNLELLGNRDYVLFMSLSSCLAWAGQWEGISNVFQNEWMICSRMNEKDIIRSCSLCEPNDWEYVGLCPATAVPAPRCVWFSWYLSSHCCCFHVGPHHINSGLVCNPVTLCLLQPIPPHHLQTWLQNTHLTITPPFKSDADSPRPRK